MRAAHKFTFFGETKGKFLDSYVRILKKNSSVNVVGGTFNA